MIRKLDVGDRYYYMDSDRLCSSICERSNVVWVDEDNLIHNEPNTVAWLRYYKKNDGDYECVEYRVHGKLHNLFGLAYVYYSIHFDKVILLAHYFIHGKVLSKEQWEIEVNRIKTLEEI